MTEDLSRRTTRNAAILTLGMGVDQLLQFAFLVIAGRQLGPSEFGFYGYVLSILMLVSGVAHWGLPLVSVREMAQRPAEETSIFAATFRIRAGLSLLLLIGALVIAALTPQTPAHRWMVVLMFASLLFLPFDLSYVFDARKLSRWDVPGKLAGRFVSVGLLVVLWKWRGGTLTVVDVALCWSLLMAVSGAVGWTIGRRHSLPLHPLAATRETGRLFRLSAPITWSGTMTSIYMQGQTILVQWFSTSLETGFYALANRLITPVLIVRGILYRVLFPILSEAAHDRAMLSARLERVLPVVALVFVPMVAIGIAAAQVLMVPVFGPAYAGAVLPFQISLSVLMLSGFGSAFGTTLVASGDARTPTIGLTIGCAVSVGLCALLIPGHGATGAAVAASVGEFVAVLYPLPKFLRIAKPRVAGRLTRMALVSVASTVVFFALIGLNWLPPVAALIAMVVILLVALKLTGEISAEGIRSAVAMFRKPAEASKAGSLVE